MENGQIFISYCFIYSTNSPFKNDYDFYYKITFVNSREQKYKINPAEIWYDLFNYG